MKLFTPHREALFVSRPNRFVIVARLLDASGEPEGEPVTCHCPNPGRLLEFLVPGTVLILEDRLALRDAPAVGARAKTRWTAAAVRYRGATVPLFAARANAAARELIIPRIIPDLAELRPEYAIGRSRFDFLAVDRVGTRHLIEVKSCSLVESGVAMFPDAPSERATKHLEELAGLAREGYMPHVAFAIMHGNPERFAPNVHTDPRFAETLARLAGTVSIHAALLRADDGGNAELVSIDVPVDLSPGRLATEDRGNYLAVFEAGAGDGPVSPADRAQGWYVCGGWAPAGLAGRLARLKRKGRNATPGTVEAFISGAGTVTTLPVVSENDLSGELAAGLTALGGESATRLVPDKNGGPSFLFRFDGPPLKSRAFLDLLFRFRAGARPSSRGE